MITIIIIILFKKSGPYSHKNGGTKIKVNQVKKSKKKVQLLVSGGKLKLPVKNNQQTKSVSPHMALNRYRTTLVEEDRSQHRATIDFYLTNKTLHEKSTSYCYVGRHFSFQRFKIWKYGISARSNRSIQRSLND